MSDVHLGAPALMNNKERELLFVYWLEMVSQDAAEIFLMGDIFDFWFEYKKVVPKGYVRILGKLAELSDAGIIIHFFVGNHDMWMKDYFQKELNVRVYFEPAEFEFGDKKFLIGHGDGLGPGDKGYKRLKKIFRNPLSQWLFGILPPVLGIGLANYFSQKSRAQTGTSEEKFLGEDKEWLIAYCKEVLKSKKYDYFIFGHRHLPIDFKLNESSRYINLGDWLKFDSYGFFDDLEFELKYYKPY